MWPARGQRRPHVADWPRLAEARGRLEHDRTLRREPDGRRLCAHASSFCFRHIGWRLPRRCSSTCSSGTNYATRPIALTLTLNPNLTPSLNPTALTRPLTLTLTLTNPNPNPNQVLHDVRLRGSGACLAAGPVPNTLTLTCSPSPNPSQVHAWQQDQSPEAKLVRHYWPCGLHGTDKRGGPVYYCRLGGADIAGAYG